MFWIGLVVGIVLVVVLLWLIFRDPQNWFPKL